MPNPAAAAPAAVPYADSAAATEGAPDPYAGMPFPKSKLEDTYSKVSLEDPDRAAKVLRLASHLDRSPEEVQANMPAAEASAKAPPKSLLDDIDQNHPKTRDFVSSPQRMAVVRDDLGNLRDHEELVRQAVKSHGMWDEAIAGWQSGVVDQLARKGLLGKDAKGLAGRIDPREMPGPEQGFWHQQMAGAGMLASDYAAMIAGSLGGGVAGGGTGLVAGSAVPVVGNLSLGAVGTMVGAGAGAFALPAAIKKTLREYGNGDIKDSGEFWNRVGKNLVASAMEAGTYGTLDETAKNALIGGVTGPVGALASKAVAPIVGPLMLKNGVARVGLAGAISRTAGKTLDVGARGVSESVAMEEGSAAAEGREPTLHGVISNAIPILGLHAAHPVAGHVADLLGLQKTVDAQAFYKALGDTAEASKLRERLPEEYQKHIAKLTENGPVENVFIPADRFAEYFQEKGLDPKAVASELGAGDSFDEAQKTGAPVQIPLSQWATKVAPTEHFQALAPDIKFDADSMTPRELQAHAEERQVKVKEQMAELEAKVKEQENPATANEGTSKVEADVEAQLSHPKVGMGKAEAKANAQLWGARFRTLGEQTGRDPWELYQEHRLTVARQEGPEAVNEKMFAQAPGEKQGQAFLRERHENLTPEEKVKEHFLDPVTGTLNERAFNAMPVPEGKEVAHISVEGVKYANDNMGAGHKAGDDLYRYMGQALKEAAPEVAKVGGDFALHVKDRAELESILKKAREALPERMDLGGKTVESDGFKLSGGIGKDLAEAGKVHGEAKAAAEAKGERAKRGEAPIGFKEAEGEAAKAGQKEAAISPALRQEFAKLSPEEAFKASHIDPKSGMLNYEAYQRLPKKQYRSSIDLDGLKQINDLYGQKSGDQLLRAFEKKVQEIARERGTEFDLTHKSGDEYLAQHNDFDTLHQFWLDAERVLWQARMRFVNRETGELAVKEGIRLSGGIGTDDPAAEAELQKAKRSRADSRQDVGGAGEGDTAGLGRGRDGGVSERNVPAPRPASPPQSGISARRGSGKSFNQSASTAPPFYSKLTRTIEEKMGNSATADQVRGIIKEIKPEERKWLGVDDFLKGKEKVSKPELLEFLRANALEVKEVTKGENATNPNPHAAEFDLVKDRFVQEAIEKAGISEEAAERQAVAAAEGRFGAVSDLLKPWGSELYNARVRRDGWDGPTVGKPKFSSYTLPGGENYREVLFTLPSEKTEAPGWTKAEGNADYHSSHWDEPNVLAHVRLNDRTDAQGKKVLFVEEVQSDWHQEGRKRGYKGEADEGALDDRLTKIDEELTEIKAQARDEAIEATPEGEQWEQRYKALIEKGGEKFDALSEERSKVLEALNAARGGVPDAPFRKTWHEFAFKKLLRMAAEGGYDKVGWTTGEQQAERYDLSKQVSHIDYKKSSGMEPATYQVGIADKDGEPIALPKKLYTADELEGVVGKEMAQKIVNGEGKPDGGRMTLSGLDLKVGGEGMKGFYDSILPAFANKLGKKYGAKVGETQLGESRWVIWDTKNNEWVLEGRSKEEADKMLRDGVLSETRDTEPGRFEVRAISDGNPGSQKPFTAHSLDITPALKDAALGEGFPLFQEGSEGPRARIRIGGAEFRIDLFKDADSSSFLHETGHAFLEILEREARKEGAPADLTADYEATRKYLGAEPGSELTSEQHEKWARSFESYLMEGKAPSSALKTAFQRFKAWLMGVYQSATQLKVDINDEIRGVMDRMLGSRDEVEAARREVGMDLPLENVPKEVAGRIAELTSQAREHAEETLLKEQMAEISKGAKEKRAAERERLDKEVREELKTHPDSDPVYAAIDHLRRTTKRDPLGVANRFLEDKVTDKEAARMEETAETHGFSSGEDLARYIIANEANGGFDADVKARVEEKMPKLLEGAELKAEALKVIHDTRMTELLALEREALLGLTDRAVQSAEAARQRREQAIVTAKQVNTEAKRILDAKGMRDASNATPYFTAERNAAVRVQKAMAKKDYEGAAKAKEQQMLSHALAREAMRNADEAESLVKFLDKAGDRAGDLKKYPYGFSRQLIDMLSRRGLTDAKQEDTGVLTTIAQTMSQEGESPSDIATATGLRQNTQQAWVPETLTDFMARVNENYMALELPASVLGADGREYRKLTLPELRDLKEAVKAISEIGRTYNKFKSFESQFDIDQAGALFAENVEKEFGHPASDSLRLGSRNKGTIDKALGALKEIPAYFARNLDTALTTVEKLDGMKDGPAKKYIYRPIAEAENRRLERLRNEMTEVDALFGKHYTPEELSKYKDDTVVMNAEGDRVSKYELLSMLLNWGNPEGRDRITRAEGMLPEELEQKLFQNLTKKDFIFAQDVWNYLDRFKPEIKELEMRTNGNEPKWVESVPIKAPWGEYEGGYYPLRYDSDRSATAFRYAEATTGLGQQYGGGKAQTEQGFTKERVATLRRPLRYDLAVLTDHLEDVVKDLTYRDAVIDVSRFLGQKDAKGAILNALGVRGYKALGDWLKAVASDPSMPTSYLGRAANWFRFKTTFYLMGYRIASMPKIALENMVNVSSELGVARAARAMGEYWFSFGGDVHNVVIGKSEFMRQRAEHLDRDMGEVLDKYRDEKGSAYHRFAFHTHAMLDQAVSFPLWSSVYKDSLSKGLEEKDSVHAADEAVKRTFMAGGTLNQPAVMRGSELQKAMTVAFGYQSMMWNRYSRAMTEVAQSATAGSYMDAAYIAARTHFYSFVMPAAVIALTQELLHNAAGGRHDKKDMEKRAMEAVLHEGTPLKFLPIIRDIVPYALNKVLGEHGRDLQVTPLERAVQTLIDPELEMLARKVKGEKVFDKRSVEQIANQISLLVPVPKQVDDVVFNFLDWQRDHGKLVWQDLLKRRSNR